MSAASNETQNVELPDDDILKQRYVFIGQLYNLFKTIVRWYFTSLSESQAETILSKGSSGKQTRTSRFLVSDLPSSKNYRISIRLGS